MTPENFKAVQGFLGQAKDRWARDAERALRRIARLPFWLSWRAPQIAEEALGQGPYWSRGFGGGQDKSPRGLAAYYRQSFFKLRPKGEPMTWIILLSVLTAVGRFLIPGHGLSLPGTYEAFAHIWVGALLTLCFYERGRSVYFPAYKSASDRRTRLTALACLVAITLLETVMFLAFKKG